MTEKNSQTRNRFYVPIRLAGLVADFTDAEKGQILSAMLQYHIDATVPEFDDRALRMAWRDLQAFFDTCAEEYDARCRQNRANGKLGGRPRKSERLSEKPSGYSKTDRLFSKPKKADIDIDKDQTRQDIGGDDHASNASNLPASGDLGHDSLLDSRHTPPVNFREWTDEQFLSSVDAAISGNPELAQHRDAFVDHYLHGRTPTGKALFRTQKSWNTAGRLRTWLKNEAKWSAERTAGKQASQPAGQSTSQPVQPPLEEIRGRQYWEIDSAKEVAK